jgi:hypothetical protein
MATKLDFWGEVEPLQVRTPVAILREQAALLGTKTNNVVEAQVQSWVGGSDFYHSFNLVVPTLDNYTYQLFTLHHSANLYPVMSGYEQFQTEDELSDWLRQRLSSTETKRIVGNLLAQVNS